MIIIIINYHNGSGKSRKFSRFGMTKRIVSLDFVLRRPRKVSLNSETVEIFLRYLGDKSPVNPMTRFLRKFRKSGNSLS